MRILFDHGTPAPLRSFLTGHIVLEAKAQGWDTFRNGELLTAADAAGLDVLVTTDKNIPLPTESDRPHDRYHRAGQCAVAGLAAACGARCRRRCRRRARQLR